MSDPFITSPAVFLRKVPAYDSGLPTAPTGVILRTDVLQAGLAGNTLRCDFDAPSGPGSNAKSLRGFAVEINHSATFPDNVRLAASTTGYGTSGGYVLQDASVTFTVDMVGNQVWFHKGDVDDLYVYNWGTIKSVDGDHQVTLDLPILGSSGLIYEVIVGSDAQCVRAIWVSVVPTGSGIPLPTQRYTTVIAGLDTGVTYYARVLAVTDTGISPWSSVSAGVALAGIKAADLHNVAPNGTFGSFTAPAISSRANASCDVILQWTYTQGSVPATGFLFFYNLTGAAIAITDAHDKVGAKIGTATYTAVLSGVNPSTRYSCGVVAYTSISSDGMTEGALQSPASWANFQPAATPDFTGTIDGTSATTVKTGAANGQTAFTDTAQYRGNIPPSNNPGSLVLSFPGGFGNATTAVQANFSYTQGANIATHFAIFVKYGGGTIVTSDPHFLVSAGTGGTFYLPFPISQKGTYSFGVAAVAVCAGGPVFNSTISADLNITIGSVPVIGDGSTTMILQGPANLRGTIAVYGAMGGKIDFNTLAGTFLPRILASAASPGSMTAGEIVIFPCTSGKTWLIYYDGGNKLATGLVIPPAW